MKRISFLLIASLLTSITIAFLLVFPTAFGSVSLALNEEPPYDGYIVKIKDDVRSGLLSITDDVLTEVYAKANLYKCSDPSEISVLMELGLVEYIEKNCEAILMSGANDSLYYKQWNIRELGIEKAWDSGLNGQGIKVAVIDSGINSSHEEFSGVNIITGYNQINGTSDVTDRHGHGTFVSGIMAAARNNEKGIAGIADKMSIVPIKCFDSSQNTNVDYIISAIYTAVDRYGCDIINMSLGTETNLKSLKAAVDYAQSKNVLVISAVGNDYSTRYFYPAAYDNVIGVGSVNKNKEVSDFSQKNSSVFVVAPGEEIVSLRADTNDNYLTSSGTSQATPHVTALAVLARDMNPDINLDQFKQLLIESSVDLGPVGYDVYYGYGLINFGRFTDLLNYYSPGNKPPEATAYASNATDKAIYSGSAFTKTYDISKWFFDPDGDELSYSLFSNTGAGSISQNGNTLSYTISPRDVDKSVRIVVSAFDGEFSSTNNAILTLKVEADNYDTSAADAFLDLYGHWGKIYAAFGISHGILKGIDSITFAPDSPMTRAMFVTALARLYGGDISHYYPDFNDVQKSDWYGDSVAWAHANSIVEGVGEKLFAPGRSVSREQMAVFMYRYARGFGLDDGSCRENVLYGYTDVDKISSWAEDAMIWAVSNGLISGKTGSALDPSGSATRAEVSAILTRFCRSFL